MKLKCQFSQGKKQKKEKREVCTFWSILHPIPLQCGRRLREFWHNDLHSWEVHLFVEPSLKSKSDVHSLLSRKGAIYLHVSSNSYIAVFSFLMSHTFFGIRTSQSKTGSIIGQKKNFGGGRSLFFFVAFCRNDFFSISSDFQEMVNFYYVFLSCNQKTPRRVPYEVGSCSNFPTVKKSLLLLSSNVRSVCQRRKILEGIGAVGVFIQS